MKKADVADTLVPAHAGLLVDEPPAVGGLPFT
jgi:hypothetical protein